MQGSCCAGTGGINHSFSRWGIILPPKRMAYSLILLPELAENKSYIKKVGQLALLQRTYLTILEMQGDLCYYEHRQNVV